MPLSDADVWGGSPTSGTLTDAQVWGPPSPSAGAQLGAGATEGITGTLGMVADAINPWNPIARTINRTSELFGGKPVVQESNVGHTLNQGLGAVIGYNPENVPAATSHDRLIRSIGAGLTGALIPGEEGFTVLNMIKNAAIGAGAGAGSDVAQENAPDNLKPIVGAVGGIAGALATHGAIEAPGLMAKAAARVVDPYVAAASHTAAEAQAATKFASQAKSPQTVRDMLETSPEIVPGSQPTTAQLTGDTGLLSGERAEQVKNSAPYAEVRGEQNSARVGAINGLEEGGDVQALPQAIKAQFDAVDADTAQHVADLTTKAQAKLAETGKELTPEAHGELLQDALDTAERASKAKLSGLYDVIPEDATGNMQRTAAAAQEIQGAMANTAKPMDGEEAGIFRAAQELPDIAPIGELTALRTRVGDAMRAELRSNGSSQVYRRLTQLRGAIQNNLAESISNQIADEAGPVSRGEIGADQSTAARLQEWVDDYNRQRQAAGTNAGADTGSLLGGAAQGDVGADGAGLPPAGGLPGPAGDQGLSANIPTFDDLARENLAKATAAARTQAQTFGAKPVAAVLARDGTKDVFKLPQAKAPEKFFHPGPAAYNDMQALYKAIGQPQGVALMRDYAASSLRRAAMDPETGVINPAKFASWSARHADALRALPDEVRASFANASRAGQAVADAVTARRDALKASQESAVGKIMGITEPQGVVREVGSIFARKTAAADMKALADAARKDPQAIAGLRRAVVDHITSKLIGNTEVGASGQTGIKADVFQTFVKNNRPVLAEAFNPAEVRNIEAVSEDIMRAKRSETAVKIPGGSNTAQDTAGLNVANRVGKALPRATMDGLGILLGHALGGSLGGFVGYLGAEALTAFRNSGIRRVGDIVSEAYLHPEFAKELMKKVPVIKDKLSNSSQIAAAIRRYAISSGVVASGSGSSPKTIH